MQISMGGCMSHTHTHTHTHRHAQMTWCARKQMCNLHAEGPGAWDQMPLYSPTICSILVCVYVCVCVYVYAGGWRGGRTPKGVWCECARGCLCAYRGRKAISTATDSTHAPLEPYLHAALGLDLHAAFWPQGPLAAPGVKSLAWGSQRPNPSFRAQPRVLRPKPWLNLPIA